MGEYTVSIRYLVERGYPLALDQYPIFSEEYRPYLNQKIIDHFFFREIGQETPDRFNFFLRRKMNEIMPYYNKLYESTLIEFNPLATEFFQEGREHSTDKLFESLSKNKGKRAETVGEVFSRNEDTKHDQTVGQVANEKVTGSYDKSGNKTVDTTGKKLEDLTQDKTGKRTEALSEEKSGTKTDTTDMNVKEVGSVESDGTAKKVGTQDTTFSDIPQAGIETTVVTAPDGTITRTTHGYATTTTNVSSSETTTTHDESNSTNNTDTAGTVKSETADTKTNANVIDDVEKVANDNTTTTEGKEVTKWDETGANKGTTDYTNDENTNAKGNTKEDSERNVATNVKTGNEHSEHSKTGESGSEMLTGSGRRGANPSELIKTYRQSLINVDMMVIAELETLFMGVY